ncbi:hypothetical protein MMYC01_202711 [Madurella mycetomatis]|uniref:Uncharacterized protein n=1 Tax=Madurella mycetomatis TaxID=100816 RepID=A0A175WCG7_9PEZI|nr:hypothetical protein MMYC01_202711 [Madurella mycetomatis]
MFPKFVALVLLVLYLPLSLANEGYEADTLDVGADEWDDSTAYDAEDQIDLSGDTAGKTCYFAAGCTDGSEDDPSVNCPPDHQYMGVETEHSPLKTESAPSCPEGQGHPVCCPKDIPVVSCGWQGEPGQSEFGCIPGDATATDPLEYGSMEAADPGADVEDPDLDAEDPDLDAEDPALDAEDPALEAEDTEPVEEY